MKQLVVSVALHYSIRGLPAPQASKLCPSQQASAVPNIAAPLGQVLVIRSGRVPSPPHCTKLIEDPAERG